MDLVRSVDICWCSSEVVQAQLAVSSDHQSSGPFRERLSNYRGVYIPVAPSTDAMDEKNCDVCGTELTGETSELHQIVEFHGDAIHAEVNCRECGSIIGKGYKLMSLVESE